MIARLLRSTRRLVPAALLALALASPAVACTCLPTPSVEDSKAASQALFTGIPIAIEDVGSGKRVTFQVTAIWKGVVPAEYSVYAGDPQMCGVDFTLGEEWLVYAFPFDDPEVYTHSCSRTARAAGNPDIEALGPPLSTPAFEGSWGLLKAIYR